MLTIKEFKTILPETELVQFSDHLLFLLEKGRNKQQNMRLKELL